ncbi:MAG: PKD domain-containing protein [Desulfobulbus sp.]
MFVPVIRFLFWLLLLVPGSLFAAENRSIHVEWGYTPPSQPSVTGFKLYQEGVLACRSDNPNATALDCTVTLLDNPTNFTLTATFADGTESPHSAPFAFSGTGEASDALAGTSEKPAADPVAVLSSSTAAGACPLTVSFDAADSSAASGLTLVNYVWDYGDGSRSTGVSAAHVYSVPGTYTATLTVVDSQGQQNSIATPIVITVAADGSDKEAIALLPKASAAKVIVADLASSSAATTDADVMLESGEIVLTSNWARVSFATPYVHPIVVAGPPHGADMSPCTVRIRNVTTDGFDIRLVEWPYQDGIHGKEIVSYLVLEQGRTVLADGSVIEAGSFSGSSKLKLVPFSASFSSNPVVFTSVTTVNEAEAVAGRVLPLGTFGFIYLLKEQEKNFSSGHADETVHYVAWEPGKGVMGTMQYEAFFTDRSVTHQWSTIPLHSTFERPPILFADMQTFSELNTANLRVQEVSTTGFQTKVQEEQSLDNEVEHTREQVGYLAISQTSAMRLATFSWEFDEEEEHTIRGFHLLVNGEILCATDDVTARTLICELPQPMQVQAFVMEAVHLNNEVSAPSNSLVYQP